MENKKLQENLSDIVKKHINLNMAILSKIGFEIKFDIDEKKMRVMNLYTPENISIIHNKEKNKIYFVDSDYRKRAIINIKENKIELLSKCVKGSTTSNGKYYKVYGIWNEKAIFSKEYEPLVDGSEREAELYINAQVTKEGLNDTTDPIKSWEAETEKKLNDFLTSKNQKIYKIYDLEFVSSSTFQKDENENIKLPKGVTPATSTQSTIWLAPVDDMYDVASSETVYDYEYANSNNMNYQMAEKKLREYAKSHNLKMEDYKTYNI